MPAVSDVMTRGVRSLTPGDNLVAAAQAMKEFNVGVIPVCDGERLVGVVTDRDIVVRGVAQDLDLKACTLSQVMSGHVRTVRESDEVDDVLDEMAVCQVRRMPVVDTHDRLIGMISLADVATRSPQIQANLVVAFGEISTPSEPDRGTPSQSSEGSGGGTRQKQPG